MARTDTLNNFLTDVADSIRNKKGTTEPIQASNFDTEIESIESGGSGNTTQEDEIITKTIKEYSNDRVTSIGAYVFYDCTLLTMINLPNVTSIGNYIFYNCKLLSTVNLPNVTSIGTYTFNKCAKLTMIALPLVTSLGGYNFQNCDKLTTINLPNVTSVNSYVFYGCSSLTTLDLPKVKTITGSNVFQFCSALTTLILRSETMCTISQYYFSNTPIGNGTGYIYVPASLVDSYKSGTNWSAYAAQIRAIEDYPEIVGG